MSSFRSSVARCCSSCCSIERGSSTITGFCRSEIEFRKDNPRFGESARRFCPSSEGGTNDEETLANSEDRRGGYAPGDSVAAVAEVEVEATGVVTVLVVCDRVLLCPGELLTGGSREGPAFPSNPAFAGDAELVAAEGGVGGMTFA